MIDLLLDANLSPETTRFLRSTFGLDVVDLICLGLSALNDEEVVTLAQSQGRVIVTFDLDYLDYGDIYHRGELGAFGVIVLRLGEQTIDSVNRALARFFRDDAPDPSLGNALIVVDEKRSRINRAR